MESMDIVAQNVENIGNLFPDCITEARDENGKIQKVVDRDRLMQKFSHKIIGGGTTERYEFTWVGKNTSRVEANTTTNKTLRPCIEESKDWDNTENLYIEGDNLEVLKLLQNSYFNKVKMIYIDPPYNTGKDFIYRDKFSQNINEYEEAKGSFDEEGNRLFKNTDTNGRFHSDWCSMIYPRLILARNLLADDGVIFISIDDNEQENLKKICNEVFGEDNFIAQLVVILNPRGSQSSKNVAIMHEYVFCIAKSSNTKLRGLDLSEENKKEYNKFDDRGFYRELGLRKRGADSKREDSPTMYFPIYYDEEDNLISTSIKYNNVILPKLSNGDEGRWRWSKSKVEKDKSELVVRQVKRNGNLEYDIFTKDYLTNDKRKKAMSLWNDKLINNEVSTEYLQSIFDKIKVFDFAKSVDLIKQMLVISTVKNDIILDFFSGSATTAHAVMQLNAEDGGKRKFIMVQLPEKTDEKSEAFKAGYKNICEIGKERIRRAGEKIKEEAGLNGQDLDIGFRVLKLDSSNMKDIYYSADEYDQGMLENMQSNTKEDRTDLDLLFGCLVDWGLELDKPYTIKEINGHKVHIYNDGDLVACFEKDLDMKTIDEIAKLQALRVVFCDNSFVDSATKINVAEHFKMIAPDTDIKVI